MTPFKIFILCNLYYSLIIGVFKLHTFLPTHQLDLIHMQRAQSMHSESKYLRFEEGLKLRNLGSNRTWCLV